MILLEWVYIYIYLVRTRLLVITVGCYQNGFCPAYEVTPLYKLSPNILTAYCQLDHARIPERGGQRSGPPEKSQKYRVS